MQSGHALLHRTFLLLTQSGHRVAHLLRPNLLGFEPTGVVLSREIVPVRRRDIIKGIVGSVVVWPVAASAQQPAMPVVGFVNGASAKDYTRQLAAFLKGLSEIGFVDGQNVAI